MINTSTHLIQRLTNPTGRAVDNPFTFGAGGGRLTDKMKQELSSIWTFDGMGSANFEYGAVPESLEGIGKYSSKGNAVTDTLQFQKPVYYICHRDLESYVRETVTQLAHDETRLVLKEMCMLEANLKGKDYAQRIVGWLELNNYFLFFVDQEMYEKSLAYFGIRKS